MANPQPQPQPQSTQILAELIYQSEVIGDLEKREFLSLLPSLSSEQMNEIMDFFVSAEKETSEHKTKFNEKQTQLYSEFAPKINHAFQSARQMVQATSKVAKFKNI